MSAREPNAGHAMMREMAERLARETSPYLLQHKDNPVDWFPWGTEAFERAKKEDKPILLSIGYSACHWCHVMAHESFEDPAIAEIMNERFINIKVDREERPDVDSVYMEAVQAMTGQGGWPMTVFLSPEGVPFYGGTYFPPEDRHGLPSFSKLLVAVSETWKTRRGEVVDQGGRLVEHIGTTARLRPSQDPISEGLLQEAMTVMRSAFDPENGGFGGAPKFPQPMTVDFLMRIAERGHSDAGDMASRTLDAMSSGGMFDQLGGGFCRYSVDNRWIIPHFEKMLYDNAQLLRTYARSWLRTGSARHREVAEMTANWMLTEMRDHGGGFWSALDADSEGEEGKYYVWSLDEVREVCGPDAGVAIERFGFTEEGNFEGRNNPVLAAKVGDEPALERARAALLARRSERVRPGTDDKVLAGWTALAAASLAESGVILNRPEWIRAAGEALVFVLDTMRRDGRLMRAYRDGTVNHLGCAEDYAFALEASLALYEATGDERWLSEAVWFADEAIGLFADDGNGGFFTTGHDAEALVVRPKDLLDNAMPAAGSVMALELQRLALITGETRYEEQARAAMRLCVPLVGRMALGLGHILGAFDFYLAEPLEVVLVGGRDERGLEQMLEVVGSRFRPNKVVIVRRDESSAGVTVPLLEGRDAMEGKATAYLCRRGRCDLPVNDPSAFRDQFEAA
jgi:uncharacterized protein